MEGRRALNASEEARERILATVDSIPRGRVATYGQVAEEAGLTGRARLVGHSLRGLGPRSRIPWGRVLGAGGCVRVGGAAGVEQITAVSAARVQVERRITL